MYRDLDFDTAFRACDPYTGRLLQARAACSTQQLHHSLESARAAARQWAHADWAERAGSLRLLADALRKQAGALVAALMAEIGKLRFEAEEEVARAADWCEFVADQGEQWLADEWQGGARLIRRPWGIVLAVAPWNYPLWQLVRPLATALAAGNACLLKPPPAAPITSGLLEPLLQQCLPPGLAQLVWLDELGTISALAASDLFVFTGGETAGRQLAAQAGHYLKPCVLELGGNNAMVVLEDADIASAARLAAKSRCTNAGQRCTAIQRLIVVDTIASEFREALLAELGRYRCGERDAPTTTLAPMATAGVKARLQRWLSAAQHNGAQTLLGGQAAGGEGYHFPATLLQVAGPGNPAFDEELFGPAATLTAAPDALSAISMAGQVRQGLVASVWGGDVEQVRRLLRGFRAGSLFINRIPSSRFELPFAGTGASGFGSTLGRDGLLAMTQPQVWA
ncbi:aldehyde dehydrogenase family protein [Parachitinimonas caeni]|uniref:Aldehyde dehydrogenase family protein n=1 Tax=Parachitinimonas caeni TaxID=3031301 RepID=A0ABT7E066_9NEIS|nr:aldehyde dehydrogenase family protein [Parachitinimonas caeni]MDK2125681.1 aldehyde dehydrogenase family protein [Parachitinimonas caeni]